MKGHHNTPMHTKHGYPVLLAISERSYPDEFEYIVAHLGNDRREPFVCWMRRKDTLDTFSGHYFTRLRDAEDDAIRRSQR